MKKNYNYLNIFTPECNHINKGIIVLDCECEVCKDCYQTYLSKADNTKDNQIVCDKHAGSMKTII